MPHHVRAHVRHVLTHSPLVPVLVGLLAVTSALLTSTAPPTSASAQAPGYAGVTASLADRGPALSRGAGRSTTATEQATLRTYRLHGLRVAQQRREHRLAQLRAWNLPTVPGYLLTARFGASGHWSHLHTGLDFAAPEGTPVLAVARGRVISTGYEGSYGNVTKQRLPDGTVLYYGHQSSFSVSPGERVVPGEVIGRIGSTGNVTGPHVHLEVRPAGGAPVDPYPVLTGHGLHP